MKRWAVGGIMQSSVATAVFDEMRKGLPVDRIQHPGVGEPRITSSITVDAGLVSPVIERFSQEHPHASLQVLNENIAAAQYDNLRNRNVELVLGRIPVAMTETDLVAETLFDEPNVIVAGTESGRARRRTLALPDLIGEPWILAQPGTLARSLQDETFRMNGVAAPSVKVQMVSLHLYMRLIETGRWLGLVPALAVRFGAKSMRIKILPVKTRHPPAPVGSITVTNRTLTALAQRFIDCARAVAWSNTSCAAMQRR